MKWGKKTPGRWAPLQQPLLACVCSCFQVPVRGGARHTETRRPRGKREHPTTAGSGLSSHTLHTHKQTSTVPETYRAHHTHTHTRVLLENKSFMSLDQVTTVTSHLSVWPTLNKNWETSIDTGVCPYMKNFFPNFFLTYDIKILEVMGLHSLFKETGVCQ